MAPRLSADNFERRRSDLKEFFNCPRYGDVRQLLAIKTEKNLGKTVRKKIRAKEWRSA